MKIRKIITGISSVFVAVVIIATAIPAYAYAEHTEDIPGYGTLKGRQDDLYEQDYNQICWVKMHTTLSGWNSGMHTVIAYIPVDTATGLWLEKDPSEICVYGSSCSADCYISDYGYYEDTGDVALFSEHWAEGNGVEDVKIYLKSVY